MSQKKRLPKCKKIMAKPRKTYYVVRCLELSHKPSEYYSYIAEFRYRKDAEDFVNAFGDSYFRVVKVEGLGVDR